jgi:sec-independent protein translocase protein TatA
LGGFVGLVLIPGLPTVGGPELIILLVIVLLLFGAKRIPELAKGLGSGVREFRQGVRGDEKDEELEGGKGKDSSHTQEETARMESDGERAGRAERSEQKH